MEKDIFYVNRKSNCEPMLSKYGLYPKKGGGIFPGRNISGRLEAILWLLFYCDGSTPLHFISKKVGVSIDALKEIGAIMEKYGLLTRNLN